MKRHYNLYHNVEYRGLKLENKNNVNCFINAAVNPIAANAPIMKYISAKKKREKILIQLSYFVLQDMY